MKCLVEGLISLIHKISEGQLRKLASLNVANLRGRFTPSQL